MKKEFYKLFLVFAMILFSFSLAFFLGREITLSDQQIQKEKQQALKKNQLKAPNLSSVQKNTSTNKVAPRLEGDSEAETNVEAEAKTEADRINSPPTELNPTKQKAQTKGATTSSPISNALAISPKATSKASPKVTSATIKTSKTKAKQAEEQKNTPGSKQSKNLKKNKKPPLYAVMIKSHKTKPLAVESSAKFKYRFPEWRWFLKKSKKSYKVYIGPFEQKNLAEQFLQELKKKKQFASAKVEKI